MKPPQEITIPREWLKRLNDIYDTYRTQQGRQKEDSLMLLMGYLASVETILKIK